MSRGGDGLSVYQAFWVMSGHLGAMFAGGADLQEVATRMRVGANGLPTGRGDWDRWLAAMTEVLTVGLRRGGRLRCDAAGLRSGPRRLQDRAKGTLDVYQAELLGSGEAFLAASRYVERHVENGFDEVDLILDTDYDDGVPGDPAAWEDWVEVVTGLSLADPVPAFDGRVRDPEGRSRLRDAVEALARGEEDLDWGPDGDFERLPGVFNQGRWHLEDTIFQHDPAVYVGHMIVAAEVDPLRRLVSALNDADDAWRADPALKSFSIRSRHPTALRVSRAAREVLALMTEQAGTPVRITKPGGIEVEGKGCAAGFGSQGPDTCE